MSSFDTNPFADPVDVNPFQVRAEPALPFPPLSSSPLRSLPLPSRPGGRGAE